MTSRAIGQFFDNSDLLFQFMNSFTVGLVTVNALCRGGVIAELLKGPAHPDELAERCNLPADKLTRLTKFLAAHELVYRAPDGTLTATDRTRVIHEMRGYFASNLLGTMAGTKLLEGIRENRIPFELQYGKPAFEYFASHLEEASLFSEFMGITTRMVQDFVAKNHRFEPFETVADIGSSMGHFLLSVLETYPETKGILFDLPDVVERAAPNVTASPSADRVRIVGGSFFDTVPSADLYLLKQILHDWSDEECITILRNVRSAINPGGRVAVVDFLMPDEPEPTAGMGTDIAMMFWDTGRERKRDEFEKLFESSGFVLSRITANPNGQSVIEAVPT